MAHFSWPGALSLPLRQLLLAALAGASPAAGHIGDQDDRGGDIRSLSSVASPDHEQRIPEFRATTAANKFRVKDRLAFRRVNITAESPAGQIKTPSPQQVTATDPTESQIAPWAGSIDASHSDNGGPTTTPTPVYPLHWKEPLSTRNNTFDHRVVLTHGCLVIDGRKHMGASRFPGLPGSLYSLSTQNPSRPEGPVLAVRGKKAPALQRVNVHSRYPKHMWLMLPREEAAAGDECAVHRGRYFIVFTLHPDSPAHFLRDELVYIHALLADYVGEDLNAGRQPAIHILINAPGGIASHPTVRGMLAPYTSQPVVDLLSITDCRRLEWASVGNGDKKAAGSPYTGRAVAQIKRYLPGFPLNSPGKRLPSMLLVERLARNPMTGVAQNGRVFLNGGDMLRALQRGSGEHKWGRVLPPDAFEYHNDVREQIQVVRSADIVIMAHGAGNTWGLFMAPGAVLVELASCMRLTGKDKWSRPKCCHVAYDLSKNGTLYESEKMAQDHARESSGNTSNSSRSLCARECDPCRADVMVHIPDLEDASLRAVLAWKEANPLLASH